MALIKKTWAYGHTIKVVVVSFDKTVLAAMDPISKEGFILICPDLKHTPQPGEEGQIIFTAGGPTGGYFKYFKINNNPTA